VPDVEKFPGHIACDGASRSEIVVPIVVVGRMVGVIDVDCSVVDGFDDVDKQGLKLLAQLLALGCDW
jgi:L-methionine (R)-S-oxide reductase